MRRHRHNLNPGQAEKLGAYLAERPAPTTLLKSMTPAQFDNGYWYATELREFATAVGIPSGHRLRKDELEKAIKRFLASALQAIQV